MIVEIALFLTKRDSLRGGKCKSMNSCISIVASYASLGFLHWLCPPFILEIIANSHVRNCTERPCISFTLSPQQLTSVYNHSTIINHQDIDIDTIA